MAKNKKRKLKGGIFIALFYFITSNITLYLLSKFMKIDSFLILLIMMFIVFSNILVFISILIRKNKFAPLRYFKYFCCFLFIILYSAASFFLYKGLETSNKLFSSKNTSIYLVRKKGTKASNNVATIQNIEAEDLIDKEKLTSKIVYYNNYKEIASDFESKKINEAIVKDSFYNFYPKKDLDVIYELSTKEKTKSHDIDKPMSVLMMGIDSSTNSIQKSNSFNGDSLILATFNPKTLNTTLLSIPRDSFVKLGCSRGKDKINAASMYGTECMVKTVEQLFNIKIDYTVKINFIGLVDLVNAVNGIDVDVEYAFCEQNSKRQFGKHTIYVEKGKQRLNGEQALAYSRNRHSYPFCGPKYSKGVRSDFERGKHQKKVIMAIAGKMKEVRSTNEFNKIIDSISRNMTTNITSDTMMSLFKLVKEADSSSFIHIDNMQLKGRDQMMTNKGNLRQYFYVLSEDSVSQISNEMKVNLGLKEPTIIKSFSYNTYYTKKATGLDAKNAEGFALVPDFKEMTISDAKAWGIRNKVCVNIREKEGTIISQDIVPGKIASDVKGCINLEVKKKDKDKDKDEDNKSKEKPKEEIKEPKEKDEP